MVVHACNTSIREAAVEDSTSSRPVWVTWQYRVSKTKQKTKEAMTVTSYVQPFPWPLGSCRGSEINEVYLTRLSHQA